MEGVVETKNIISHEGGYSLEMAPDGTVLGLHFAGKRADLSQGSTFYELNGLPAETTQDSDGYVLAANSASARLSLIPGRELVLRLTALEGAALTSWGMTVALPLSTQFHLAEHVNTGRMLDSSMPLGEFYAARLTYNFLVAGSDGLWLRFMSRGKPLHKLEVTVERHTETFLLTTTWHLGDGSEGADDARLGVFASLEEALDDHAEIVRGEMGVKPFRERHDLPGWIHNVRLMFTVDMMRSHGEVSHTYAQAAAFVEALHGEGCPKDTLLRFPGWSGPFDSLYPTYRPHPGLGTDKEFAGLIDTIHRCGYRVMLHTLGWGIDPYHPDIDRLMPLVRRREDGSLAGYKISDAGFPPTRRIHYRSGRVKVRGTKTGNGVEVQTAAVPCLCESTLTIGGITGPGVRIRAAIRERIQTTPEGCFASSDTFRFPFPFLLGQGENRILLESVGQEEPDWSACWYTIDHCFVAKSLYLPSTRPILKADTGSAAWAGLYVGELERVLSDYGPDALYVDATTYTDPPGSRSLFAAIAERIPHIPIGCEWCDHLDELGQWTFCFGAVRSLIDSSPKLNEPRDAKSGSIRRGIERRYAWLDHPSPACRFVRDHLYFHCAPDAFVPVGTIVDMNPKWQLYTDPSELYEQLADSPRLGFVPTIKVNFADYGVDEYTKKMIRLVASRGKVPA